MSGRGRTVLRILICALVLTFVSSGIAFATGAGEAKHYVFQNRATEPNLHAWYDQLINQFNKDNPKTVFENSPVNSAEQEQLLYVQYSSGNPPLIAWTTMAQSAVLSQRGLIADLRPYYAKYKWDDRIPLAAKSVWTDPNGAVHGAPFEGGIYPFLHFNAALFRELGIAAPGHDVPMTVPDFMKMLDRIKAAGIYPIALGNRDEWTLEHIVRLVMQQTLPPDKGAALWTDPNGPKMTDERPLAALKWLASLLQNGYFAPGVNSMNDNEARALLYTKKAAIYTIGMWWPQMVIGDKMQDTFEADFMLYPKMYADVPYNMSASVHGYTINKKGDVDAAAKMVDWMISLENQKAYAKVGGSTLIKGAVTAETAALPIALEYFKSMDKVVGLNTEPNETMILDTRKIIGALVDPNTPVEDIAAKLQAAKLEVYKK
jgi:raffinose/stachyose/melibiose transport system substrate-binding protein